MAPLAVHVAAAFASVCAAAIVLWVVAFGQATACTDEFLCTAAQCPARCDRPEQYLLIALPALAGAGCLGVILARRIHRRFVAALPLLLVTLVAAVAMTRW